MRDVQVAEPAALAGCNECAHASQREAALRRDLSAAREAEVAVMRSLQSELRR